MEIGRGPRIRLRELEESDWSAVHAYTGDEAISRYQAWDPHSEADALAWVRRAIAERGRPERSSYYWGIEDIGAGQIIGGIGIDRLPNESSKAEIGYSLRRNQWGIGLGSEALAIAVKYAFSKTAFDRLVAHCRDRNLASIRLLERAGFRREGYFIDDVRVRGEPMSSYRYESSIYSKLLDQPTTRRSA